MSSQKQPGEPGGSEVLDRIRICIYWILRCIHFIVMAIFIPVAIFLYSLSILLQIIMYNVNPRHGDSDEINEVWDRHT